MTSEVDISEYFSQVSVSAEHRTSVGLLEKQVVVPMAQESVSTTPCFGSTPITVTAIV